MTSEKVEKGADTSRSCEKCFYWHERCREDQRKRCTSPKGLCQTTELENFKPLAPPMVLNRCEKCGGIRHRANFADMKNVKVVSFPADRLFECLHVPCDECEAWLDEGASE